MKQEDKELLLKDLCARLSYGVKVQIQNEAGYDITFQLSGYSMGYFYVNGDAFEEDEIKPYLRPMSSMTEDEQKEFNKVVFDSQNIDGISASTYVSDWLISRQFDVHGLIPKGLALEAPKDMYKF